MEEVVIIGAGGFAREVVDVIDAVNLRSPQFEVIGYIVDAEYGNPGTLVNDLPILGGFDWLARHAGSVRVTCGVGPSQSRYRLVRRAADLGCRFFTLIHPAAIVTRRVTIGRGVVITAGSILTNNIILGDHVHVNLGCTIGHDVRIADYVTLAPAVHLSGNVHVADGAYIGTGTNVIEKVHIGAWSVVGAGSTVIRDVIANTTVVGVPAKTIKERGEGWQLL